MTIPRGTVHASPQQASVTLCGLISHAEAVATREALATALIPQAYGTRYLRPYLNANESLLIDTWRALL